MWTYQLFVVVHPIGFGILSIPNNLNLLIMCLRGWLLFGCVKNILWFLILLVWLTSLQWSPPSSAWSKREFSFMIISPPLEIRLSWSEGLDEGIFSISFSSINQLCKQHNACTREAVFFNEIFNGMGDLRIAHRLTNTPKAHSTLILNWDWKNCMCLSLLIIQI